MSFHFDFHTDDIDGNSEEAESRPNHSDEAFGEPSVSPAEAELHDLKSLVRNPYLPS